MKDVRDWIEFRKDEIRTAFLILVFAAVVVFVAWLSSKGIVPAGHQGP